MVSVSTHPIRQDPRRTAVVTGASSGIGAATARRLAAEGFHVFCAARRADRVEALAAEIGGTAVVCDVTSAESVAGLAAAVGERLDVLVNNAGGAFGATPVAEADTDDWRAMYDVNVIGLVQVTQALLPALVRSGAGTIVNVGSTAGRIAYEGGGGYTAAKHGTKVVTETLRLELWDQPVRVCEIAPGMVRTDEFALVRFEGDAGQGGRRLRRRRRAAGRRGHRRRDRLDRHPAAARQRRRAGDPPARAGGPAQGAPRLRRGRVTLMPDATSGEMQTIGLVGGMSWESSAAYYRDLNLGVQRRLGGLSSPKLVMATVDFAAAHRARGRREVGPDRRAARRRRARRRARGRGLPAAVHDDVPQGRRRGAGRRRHPAAAPRRRGGRRLPGRRCDAGRLHRHRGRHVRRRSSPTGWRPTASRCWSPTSPTTTTSTPRSTTSWSTATSSTAPAAGSSRSSTSSGTPAPRASSSAAPSSSSSSTRPTANIPVFPCTTLHVEAALDRALGAAAAG